MRKAKAKKKTKRVKKKQSPASAGARAMATARWAKPGADRNQPREAGKLGGRPKGSITKDKERCGCGCGMTIKRALARNHKP